MKITSICPSKSIDEKEKNKKQKENCNAFCVTHQPNNLQCSLIQYKTAELFLALSGINSDTSTT